MEDIEDIEDFGEIGSGNRKSNGVSAKSAKVNEAVRRYNNQRRRYYFAVVFCDSASS